MMCLPWSCQIFSMKLHEKVFTFKNFLMILIQFCMILIGRFERRAQSHAEIYSFIASLMRPFRFNLSTMSCLNRMKDAHKYIF